MTRFLKHLFIWCALTAIFIGLYGAFCESFFSDPRWLDAIDNKRAWCLKRADSSYDVAVVGSSRAVGSFDMSALRKATSLDIINLGCYGAGYADNYIVLYKFLKTNNNKVERILLQTDVYSFSSKKSFTNAFNVYQYLPYWDDPEIRSVISSYVDYGERWTWSIMPSLRFFKYNRYFSPKEVFRRVSISKRADSPIDAYWGGEAGAAPGKFTPYVGKIASTREIDSLDVYYFDRILELCARENIKVFCYRAPEYKPAAAQITNFEEATRQVDSLVRARGLSFMQPPDAMEQQIELYLDPMHVNQLGNAAFTTYFINHLPQDW